MPSGNISNSSLLEVSKRLDWKINQEIRKMENKSGNQENGHSIRKQKTGKSGNKKFNLENQEK